MAEDTCAERFLEVKREENKMNQFNLIKADRVVCDQKIVVCDVETDILIREPLHPGSRFDLRRSRVDVVVSRCDLEIDQGKDRFRINVGLLIEKNLFIVADQGQEIKVTLSFEKCFPNQVVTECRPSAVPPGIRRRLRCQIFDVTAEERLKLNPAANTFDETLCVTIIAKIVFEDQIPLPEVVPPIPPVIPPEVIVALELAAGKIRSQIGNPVLKAELLAELEKVRALLEEGEILAAFAVLTGVKQQIQQRINLQPANIIALNLVLGDLIAAEKAILSLL